MNVTQFSDDTDTIFVSATWRGPCGGDAGHGGFLRLEIRSQTPIEAALDHRPATDAESVSVTVFGDWEVEGLAKGLEVVAQKIRAALAVDRKLGSGK